ncbi:MAG TPA: DUF1844 domain-containing protein [Vicinamibacteria bacterium]|nr:DUF1844 domain-containing protein [Vicinamibacteria bacterium]
MTEDTKAFTVKDRRHFNATGEARDEAAAAQPAPEPLATPSEEPRRPEQPSAAPHEYPADFSGLVVSLAAQAASFLANQPPELVGAQAFIHLIEVLEDKTAGRRTPEEDRLIERLLFELRMGFVALRRSSGA